LTDEANSVSRRLWEGLGGSTALLYSIHWTRLLRPSRFAASLVQKLGLWAPLISASKPFCGLADSILARRLPRHFGQSEPQVSAEELTLETLLHSLSEFSATRSLWPEYDEHSLRWLLDELDRKGCSGVLRKIALRNDKREIIGWYIYHLNPGGMSTAVQVVARKNSFNEVLDHLFFDAWRRDSIALSGQLEPQYMQSFSDKRCQLDCGKHWMLIHSHNRDLLDVIHHGDALLSGLEGELCMRFR
jgi:hypothetical protein